MSFKNKELFLTLFCLFIQNFIIQNSYSKLIEFNDNKTIDLAINIKYGSTIQFDESVHVITSPHYFQLKPIDDKEKISPKIFQIYVNHKNNLDDKINVIFWNGKTISLHLIPDDKNADTLYRLRSTTYFLKSSNKNKNMVNDFLSQEKNLILKMISDNEFNLEDKKEIKLDLEKLFSKGKSDLNHISSFVVKNYEDGEIEGYKISLEKKFPSHNDENLKINISQLEIGTPNRVLLVHANQDSFQTCESQKICSIFIDVVLENEDVMKNFTRENNSDSQSSSIINKGNPYNTHSLDDESRRRLK